MDSVTRPVPSPAEQLGHVGRRLFLVWSLLSLAAGTALSIGLMVRGPAFFYVFQGPEDASLVEVKFLVYVAAWTLLGGALWLTRRASFLRRHGLFVVVWLLIALGYLNVVRGPHKVPHVDFTAYFVAAEQMRDSVPLKQDPKLLYLYPPLLATVLGPLVPFGLGPASWLFRFSNYAALLLFTGLLYASLQRLGTSRALAALLTMGAMVANVPVSDTLYAQQVNLHVANLILAAFLLFPKRSGLSAAALAIGMHLKVFPALLILPFAYLRRWRWLGWFAAVAMLVVVATSVLNSFSYYPAFFSNASALREAGIRNASVASFIHNTARLSGVALGSFERPIGLASQILLVSLAMWWGFVAMRTGLLVRLGSLDERVVGSSIAGLSIVMLVGSPSIWVHHCVLVLFPALAILLAIRTVADAALFGVAYFLVFLVPVTEIYPFSYLRLLGLMIFAVLLSHIGAAQSSADVPLLQKLESRLAGAFE